MRESKVRGPRLSRDLPIIALIAAMATAGLWTGGAFATEPEKVAAPRTSPLDARRGRSLDDDCPRLLSPEIWDLFRARPVDRPRPSPSPTPTPRPRGAVEVRARPPRSGRPDNPPDDRVVQGQYATETDGVEPVPGPSAPIDRDPSSWIEDPPIDYAGPDASLVEDIEARDGPHIPEPMVFDLMRGLGARRGEFEVNVLSLAPLARRGSHFEWAPEVEYAIRDGLALELELPIAGTRMEALKFGAQYTFGTAFDDAFIHGAQGIVYHDLKTGEWSPTLLYLAGIRLDKTWSLFAMVGGTAGSQIFPFSEEPPRFGTDIITNLSIFANVRDDLVLGLETNHSRQLRGPSELLVMPQVHWEISKQYRLQFGIGYRDDVEGRHAELGFRVIWER